MSKLILRTSMFAVAALFAQAAMADAGFKVRGGVASTTYDAEYSGFVTAYKGTSGTAKYDATTLGLTYTTPVGIYFDLSGSAGSGNHDSWRAITAASQSFKRNDQQFIVGIAGVGPASFYVGFKNGTTEMAAPKGVTINNNSICGAIGGTSPCSLGWSKDTFNAKGLILGGGVGFPLGEDGRGGTIGVNAGLGLMKANWHDDNGYSVDADTALGFSLGASYTYKFIPNFGMTVDAKYNKYSYDFNTASASSSFSIGEKTTALGVNLFVTF